MSDGVSETADADASARLEALSEQYSTYCDLTMRITELRYKANQFHAATNLFIVSAIGAAILYAFEQRNGGVLGLCDWRAFPAEALGLALLATLFGLRDVRLWQRRISNVKLLIGFRYQEIQLLERRLPHQPYAGEYARIQDAKNRGEYSDFTELERGIPRMFATLYGLVFAAIVALLAFKAAPVRDALEPFIGACVQATWGGA